MKLTFFRLPQNSLKRPTTTATTLTNDCAAEERQNCFSDIAAADDDVTLSVTRNAKNKNKTRIRDFFSMQPPAGFVSVFTNFMFRRKNKTDSSTTSFCCFVVLRF